MLRKSARRATDSVKSRSVSATVRTRTRVRAAPDSSPDADSGAVPEAVAACDAVVSAGGGSSSPPGPRRSSPRASCASCSAAALGSIRRRRSRATVFAAAGVASDAGSLSTTSYSARLPYFNSAVASSHLSDTYTRGPMTAVMPASPGTLPSVPAIRNSF